MNDSTSATPGQGRPRGRGLRYIRIPLDVAQLLRQKGLTFLDTFVWAALMAHAGRNETAWPTIKTLAQELGASRNGVKCALKRLEDVGLLAIERHPGNRSAYRVVDPRKSPPTGPRKSPHRATKGPTTGSQKSPASKRNRESNKKGGGGGPSGASPPPLNNIKGCNSVERGESASLLGGAANSPADAFEGEDPPPEWVARRQAVLAGQLKPARAGEQKSQRQGEDVVEASKRQEQTDRVSVKEAAREVGVTRETLRRWLRQRRIPGQKDRSRWFMLRHDLERVKEQRRAREPGEEAPNEPGTAGLVAAEAVLTRNIQATTGRSEDRRKRARRRKRDGEEGGRTPPAAKAG